MDSSTHNPESLQIHAVEPGKRARGRHHFWLEMGCCARCCCSCARARTAHGSPDRVGGWCGRAFTCGVQCRSLEWQEGGAAALVSEHKRGRTGTKGGWLRQRERYRTEPSRCVGRRGTLSRRATRVGWAGCSGVAVGCSRVRRADGTSTTHRKSETTRPSVLRSEQSPSVSRRPKTPFRPRRAADCDCCRPGSAQAPG